MRIGLFAFAVVAVIFFVVLRIRLRRHHRSIEEEGAPRAEECHRQCVALLQDAIESGDHAAIQKAMDKTTKDTLPYIPLGRDYPRTDAEVECLDLFKRAASIVHGEPASES